jgi:proline racemase
MFDKMRHLAECHDDLRMRMLREPRGYPAANCNLVLPPADPAAAAGFVIMEQVEYPLMSGSNTICVATVLIETGMVEATEPVTRFALDTPAGLVGIEALVEDGRARRVTFENAPAFAMQLDATVEVPDLGPVQVDLAYGGMIYAIADAAALGLRLTADEARDITRVGERIKVAAREQIPQAHPEHPEVVGPTIVCLVGPPSGPHADQRNAVVVSTGALDWSRPDTWTGALDRSPCGTATCARMAVLHARGELAIGRDFRNEGILGTVFTGRLVGETEVGGRRAVVPTISGTAWVTGYARYALDPDDPFPAGFTVADIWGAGTGPLEDHG